MEKVIEKASPEVAAKGKPVSQQVSPRIKITLKNRRVLAGEMREIGTVIGELTLKPGFNAGHIEKATMAGDVAYDLGG